MLHTPDGLELTPPPGFELEESSFAFRAKDEALGGLPTMASRHAVRPNLIVRRKPVAKGTTLEQYAGEMCGELVKTLGEVEALESSHFRFSDGTTGMVVAYELAASETITLRQYHALRLDEGMITILTLTVDRMALKEDTRQKYFEALASARISGAAPAPAPAAAKDSKKKRRS